MVARQTSQGEVVRASDTAEEVHVETAEIGSKFKFFETYQPEAVQRRTFRFTPPRDGTVKVSPRLTQRAAVDLCRFDGAAAERFPCISIWAALQIQLFDKTLLGFMTIFVCRENVSLNVFCFNRSNF